TRKVLKIAKNAPLFRSMPRAALSDLVERSRHVFYDAGDVIVCQGASRNDDDASVYLVLAGRVRVIQTQQGPTAPPIAELGAGEIFGELAILETQPRSASVMTVEPTSCLKVSGPDFLAALRQSGI
ncbi:MAG TPA: cyclic nucleotide-binding domain-containing protein, partial [Terriglobia bacterium]|nr:cyclic nucleotide-binding domain-containing protein [Terriglobia bacterium]